MSWVKKHCLISAGMFYTSPAFSADAAHKSSAAIPHMDVASFASQLFWLAISFGLLYFIMSRIALPQIHDILERRQNTVQGNLEKAAKLRDEAEDIQIAYDKALRQAENHAQEFLNNALDDLNKKNTEKLSTAMDATVDKIQKAEEKITKQKEEAVKDASKIADEIATILTEKVLEIQKNDSNTTKKRA